MGFMFAFRFLTRFAAGAFFWGAAFFAALGSALGAALGAGLAGAFAAGFGEGLGSALIFAGAPPAFFLCNISSFGIFFPFCLRWSPKLF